MRQLLLVVGLLCGGGALAAEAPSAVAVGFRHEAGGTKAARFDFRFINVAQVLQLIYGEAMQVPYVLDPEVLKDDRVVSFRYDSSNGDLRSFVAGFLDSLGFGVENRGGVDYVFKRKDVEKAGDEAELDVFVYKPRYRDTGYLSRLVGPLFKGNFTANKQVQAVAQARTDRSVPEGSAAAAIDQTADTLLFRGSRKEVALLGKLLPQVDTQVGEVAVRAYAYEVANANDKGSAFQLAVNLLGGKLSLGIGAGGDILGNAVRLKTGSIEAVFSALSSDSRFKVINAPNLRIRSGAEGSLTVGQKVPVLGAVSYPQGASQAVQSVEYQSSGVILNLRPVVRDAVIDLRVKQQISDFVKTTTGVNTSPTLNTREVTTDLSVQDGDVILMGGLTTNKQSASRDGLAFLPRLLDTSVESGSQSEILLVLQVQKI